MACTPRKEMHCPAQISAELFGEVKRDVFGMNALRRVLLRDAIPHLIARNLEVIWIGHHAHQNAVFSVHGPSLMLRSRSDGFRLPRFQNALIDLGNTRLMLLPPRRVA